MKQIPKILQKIKILLLLIGIDIEEENKKRGTQNDV